MPILMLHTHTKQCDLSKTAKLQQLSAAKSVNSIASVTGVHLAERERLFVNPMKFDTF